MAPCPNVGDLRLMAPDCFNQVGEVVYWYDVRDKSLTEETNTKTAVFLYTSLITGDFYETLIFVRVRTIYFLGVNLLTLRGLYVDRLNTGWQIGKNLEGKGRGPVWGTISVFIWRDKKSTINLIRLVCVSTRNRNPHLLNTSFTASTNVIDDVKITCMMCGTQSVRPLYTAICWPFGRLQLIIFTN